MANPVRVRWAGWPLRPGAPRRPERTGPGARAGDPRRPDALLLEQPPDRRRVRTAGIEVSHGQVDRLLARAGTNRTSLPRVRGPRYERTSPNELWHIDLKGPFYLPAQRGSRRTCHFVALVDDFSRYLLGIRAVPTKEALPVLEALAEAI